MTQLVNDTTKKSTKKEAVQLSERWTIFRTRKLGNIIPMRLMRPYLIQLIKKGQIENFKKEILIPYYPEYLIILDNLHYNLRHEKRAHKESIQVKEKNVKVNPIMAKKLKKASVKVSPKKSKETPIHGPIPEPTQDVEHLLLRAKLLEAFAKKNKAVEPLKGTVEVSKEETAEVPKKGTTETPKKITEIPKETVESKTQRRKREKEIRREINSRPPLFPKIDFGRSLAIKYEYGLSDW
jgi:hypothetical protein